jgi:large subunit ribosomal protein L29
VKLSDIRGKDSRELVLDVQSMRKELFDLRFRVAAEEISNTSRFRDLRRQIARIKTILREREASAAAQASGRS